MNKFHQITWPLPALKALLLSIAALATGSAFAGDYQLVDLGVNVTPRDINNYGEIAGARNTNQFPNIAFRWSPGTGFEDLDGTSAYAINDAGIVAGSTVTGAFVIDGNSFRGWDEHGAFGVNELGQVSGNKAGTNPYRTTSIPYDPAVYDGSKWAVMDIAKVYPRGTRQGVYADQFILFDVNDAGFAVGKKSRYGLAGSSAILIEPPYSGIKSAADVTFLPTPYGGSANAINEQNLIVGTTGNDSRSGNYAFAFLYDGVTVSNLGTLGGLRSGANDINDFDQVVGYSETSVGNRAFLWDAINGMQDLTVLVGAADWVLESAIAINNEREIVGTGRLNGQSHGFLLTSGQPPTPVNEAPVAVATADVTCGKAPLEAQFQVNQSYDPDGSIVSHAWDFGDGSEPGTGENPDAHIYTERGTYNFALTVVDDGGVTDTAQLEITVKKGKCKGGR